MDLVLFEDAMKHIARIVRVVMNSGGHALLGATDATQCTSAPYVICVKTILPLFCDIYRSVRKQQILSLSPSFSHSISLSLSFIYSLLLSLIYSPIPDVVGVGGSGKQSLSRLAAFICGFTVMQIVISSTYGINDLKDDLKAMCTKAGTKEEGVMFILTDSQITNERFLVQINDLLASGNIPDLFAPDEVPPMCPLFILHFV